MDDTTQPQGGQSTDPTQSTPPQPPIDPASGQPITGGQGQAGQQQAGGQPVGGQPPVGQSVGQTPVAGQPPVAQPPAGQPQNDLSGIMEENVDVSALVSNAGNQQQIQEFIAWAKANMPAHPATKFEDTRFIELLASSISLTQNEKKRIIESVPKLSQFQVDELMKIFIEEQQKFTELEKKHAEQMAELEKQHKSPEAEAAKKEEEEAKNKEAEEAEALKKSLGLSAANDNADAGEEEKAA